MTLCRPPVSYVGADNVLVAFICAATPMVAVIFMEGCGVTNRSTTHRSKTDL
jgi:hypothetical protein